MAITLGSNYDKVRPNDIKTNFFFHFVVLSMFPMALTALGDHITKHSQQSKSREEYNLATNEAVIVLEGTGVGNLTGRLTDLMPEIVDMAQQDAAQMIGFRSDSLCTQIHTLTCNVNLEHRHKSTVSFLLKHNTAACSRGKQL
jgi:hypothetical protein